MIEMVSRIEVAYHPNFDNESGKCSERNSQQNAQEKRPSPVCESGTDVSANHIQRTMGEIDEIHNPKGERQT